MAADRADDLPHGVAGPELDEAAARAGEAAHRRRLGPGLPERAGLRAQKRRVNELREEQMKLYN